MLLPKSRNGRPTKQSLTWSKQIKVPLNKVMLLTLVGFQKNKGRQVCQQEQELRPDSLLHTFGTFPQL